MKLPHPRRNVLFLVGACYKVLGMMQKFRDGYKLK